MKTYITFEIKLETYYLPLFPKLRIHPLNNNTYDLDGERLYSYHPLKTLLFHKQLLFLYYHYIGCAFKYFFLSDKTTFYRNTGQFLLTNDTESQPSFDMSLRVFVYFIVFS